MSDEQAAAYEDDERPEVKGPWRIQSLADLDWALERLGALEAERVSVIAQGEAACKRIWDRADVLTERLGRGAAFFEAKIEEYAQGNKDALLGGGKRKSRDVLFGRVGWREHPGHIHVTDEAALKKWLAAQENESLYRTKIVPKMFELNQLYDADGTIPPGCEYKAAEDVFYIDPKPLEEEPK